MHKKNHVCGELYCRTCQDFFPEGHQCYMVPEEHDEQEEMNSIEEELIKDIENAKSFVFF
jgi:hypothetical protein